MERLEAKKLKQVVRMKALEHIKGLMPRQSTRLNQISEEFNKKIETSNKNFSSSFEEQVVKYEEQ